MLIFFSVCAEFQVWTLLQYNYKDNSSVNIICQPDVQMDWKMGARLFINDEDVCHSDKNNTICEERKQGNQFIFTLKITAKNTRLVYQCEVYKRTPLPIVKRRGEKAELLTGEKYKSCFLNELYHTKKCTFYSNYLFTCLATQPTKSYNFKIPHFNV